MAIGGLVLLFAAWWLYFLEPAAPRLDARRDLGFIWGYGHFGVFASLAALGAGIEVTAEAVTHDVEASGPLIGYSVALPLAVYLAVLYGLYHRIGRRRHVRPAILAAEIAAVLAIPLASIALSPAWVLALVAARAAALVVAKSGCIALSAGAVADTQRVSVRRQDDRHEDAEDHGGHERREGRTPGTSEDEAR